jgi:hypothetical protein
MFGSKVSKDDIAFVPRLILALKTEAVYLSELVSTYKTTTYVHNTEEYSRHPQKYIFWPLKWIISVYSVQCRCKPIIIHLYSMMNDDKIVTVICVCVCVCVRVWCI